MKSSAKCMKFTSGMASLAVAVAVAMTSGAASARTVSVTENRDTNGIITSLNLTFSEESPDTTNRLWVALGTSDGGTDLAAWDSVIYGGDVPGDVTFIPNVPVPDGWGETVTHARCFFVSGGNSVPGGELLEYIQSSGNSNQTGQHVMTSFVPDSESAVEVKLAFNGAGSNGRPSGGNHNIFCARNGSSKCFTLFWLSNNWRWDYDKQQRASTEYNAPGTAIHVLRADKNGLAVDGNIAAGTVPTETTFTASGPLGIFGSNHNGSDWYNHGAFKLYSLKAWSDGSNPASLALDLVPCRKDDGTVCLYDKKTGDFLYNTGDGAFTAGPVALDLETAVVESASDLVFAPRHGWMTTMGKFYPYLEGQPVYVVDVAADDVKSISEVMFKEMAADGAAITNDVSFAAFTSGDPGNRTGTIIKRGEGTLRFDQDISAFKGPVHIEEGVAIGVCSNCFGFTEKAGSGVNQRTYVHSGATLVMDAVGNKPKPAESNATYYEGDGYPGMGGAYVARNGDTASDQSRWQMGVLSRAVGPASIYLDVPSGGQVAITWATVQAASEFSLNGQDVLMHGRTSGSEFALEAAQLNGIGNLVVSNMTLRVSGNSGALYASNGNKSTIRFQGGARWVWDTYMNFNRFQEQQYSTVYVDDLEYIRFKNGSQDNKNYGVNPWGVTDGTTNNWYSGPVVLNNHIRFYNNFSPRNASDKRNVGCSFTAKISGPMGFRPYEKSDGTFWGDGVRLNLLNPTNTFEGGIVMDGGSLGVWAERAVPSQEGAGLVSITNGYVYFGKKGDERRPPTQKWVNFTMPVTEFVGECAVTNGTGYWQGLVKKGEGTLDYNSQLDGAFLDLQGGTVVFNTQYRDMYTGEDAQYAPEGFEPAVPAFATLKGLAGTLDLNGVADGYTVANVEDYPSVANGNLTVTGTWTLNAAVLGTGTANISGTLTFGEGTSVVVSEGLDSLPRPAGGFLIANAASISGMPSFRHTGWMLQKRGGELRLVKPGFAIRVR